jgi:hypothetical protein
VSSVISRAENAVQQGKLESESLNLLKKDYFFCKLGICQSPVFLAEVYNSVIFTLHFISLSHSPPPLLTECPKNVADRGFHERNQKDEVLMRLICLLILAYFQQRLPCYTVKGVSCICLMKVFGWQWARLKRHRKF